MEKIIERYWKGLRLGDHKKIGPVYNRIKSDIVEGLVFPALRENESHLYHEGGRAFQIEPQSVDTDPQYKSGSVAGEASLPNLTPKLYAQIKNQCKEHNAIHCRLAFPGFGGQIG